MRHLRTKLLLAMFAVVVVTIGVSGLFTRRVTHEELRRLMVAQTIPSRAREIEDFYRAHRSWVGVPFRDRAVLTTPQREVIATSDDLRNTTVTVSPNDRITILGRNSRLVVRLPPEQILDDGRPIALLYSMPDRPPVEMREIAALDRRLITTFAAAALAALLLTYILSRRITRPVESLTLAVDQMAKGSIPSPVAVHGEDEIARLAQSFNSMAAAIAAQQELRKRMVGDVAHELRTPLTNLRCELEAAQDGLSAVNVTSLHEEVLHLNRLVEELQELAVAEAGGLKLNRAPVDVAAVVTRAVDSIRSECARRNIHLVEDSRTLVSNADETRLRQIMNNLLANALQHTPDGGTIIVRVADAVSVKNTGTRIPEEELQNIFERFYRLDESRARSSGGAGLGLAIVKQLVEMHGGRAWAESDESGTTFTFELPPS